MYQQDFFFIVLRHILTNSLSDPFKIESFHYHHLNEISYGMLNKFFCFKYHVFILNCFINFHRHLFLVYFLLCVMTLQWPHLPSKNYLCSIIKLSLFHRVDNCGFNKKISHYHLISSFMFKINYMNLSSSINCGQIT